MVSIHQKKYMKNLKKLKETGTIEHRGGNGRPSKVTKTFSRSIGQVILHNNAVSTLQLAIKLRETHNTSISHPTVWRHIKKKDYKSSVPVGTPMLTARHIEKTMAW